ncbi:hypothetical protein [Streptomyces vastus]|uniref:hypothetical protein n=1 Tax=Streptomyces vastus TaxID=285451 RepID=UPI0031D37381
MNRTGDPARKERKANARKIQRHAAAPTHARGLPVQLRVEFAALSVVYRQLIHLPELMSGPLSGV